MNKSIAIVGLLSLLVVPASASAEGDWNLAEYKTVAVQPSLSASNTPGLFESQMAAQASMLQVSPASSKEASGYILDGEDEGFGFAGKANSGDIMLLMIGNTVGMLPTLMKVNPASAKERLAAFSKIINALDGKVAPNVVKALRLSLQAASIGDFQNTTKGMLVAMAVASSSIAKGSERAHGYMATGIYSGLATLWAASGASNKALSDIAGPLVMLLEQDAAMGGADRLVAAQLKIVQSQLAAPKPDLKAVMGAITNMNKVKPD